MVVMVMRQEENSLKQVEALEALHKIHKIPPCAASYRMGWQGLQAVRFRDSPSSEFSLPPVSQHWLVLTIRPPEKMDLRYEGMKRDIPPPAGSIAAKDFGTQASGPIYILNIIFSDPTRGNANAMLLDFKMGTVAYE